MESKLILGQTYQVVRQNGDSITFMFLGDRGNVTDAVEIIESNSSAELQVGKLISLDELLAIPYKNITRR